MNKGCKYGTHRVVEPDGAFPQSCWKIDNSMERIFDNEILVQVRRLNIDAASFHQISTQAGGDPDKIGRIILQTVLERGKQHNPVTGSGGMFTGVVETIGPALQGSLDLEKGEPIASLVSLSLTPLKIDRIKKVITATDQVEIEGQAILFEKTVFAHLPEDLSEDLATAVFDVAGAPAQTAKLVKAGNTVLVVGAGGKSGLLSTYAARKATGATGIVIGAAHSSSSTYRLEKLGICNHVLKTDVTRPKDFEEVIAEATNGEMADITLNCTNVADTELGCILATKPKGLIYFFNMATNFNKAALGAEGIGSEVTMLIGNGYIENHTDCALQIIRHDRAIREAFESFFSPRP